MSFKLRRSRRKLATKHSTPSDTSNSNHEKLRRSKRNLEHISSNEIPIEISPPPPPKLTTQPTDEHFKHIIDIMLQGNCTKAIKGRYKQIEVKQTSGHYTVKYVCF